MTTRVRTRSTRATKTCETFARAAAFLAQVSPPDPTRAVPSLEPAPRLVPLDASDLAGMRWDFARTFAATRSLTSVPLIRTELKRAAHAYPIGLRRVAGRLAPVALLDARDRDGGRCNHHLAADGRWLGAYVPFHLRILPFVAPGGAWASADAEGELGILSTAACVRPDARYAFRDAEGQAGPELAALARALINARADAEALAAPADVLVEAGIVVPLAARWPGLASGEPGEPVLVVAPERVAERIGPRADAFARRSLDALALALILEFSQRAALAGAPRPAVVEPAAPGPAAAAGSPVLEPFGADWLDAADQIAF